MKQDTLWLADNGDGTYRNPVLFVDYSDPDAIRVGDTYYLTASSFNYTPGLPILTSKDLVNWTLVNYALPTIPEARYQVPRHAQGVWAPAIRHHDGYFYIYYGMPDEGIFMVRAKDALGEWEPPVCVLSGKGLIDPCPYWDEDGHAYVVHGYAKSRIGFKSVLGVFPITWDGTRAIGDDHIIYDGQQTQPTIEGPKVYARDGYVYIFAPAGGVPAGWQTVLRAKSVYGPFEERIVLKQGSTEVNGPHQGAWVETPDGEGWFLHFQSRGLYGRIVHLQPLTWQADGFPFIGRPDPAPIDEPQNVGEDAAEAAKLAAKTDCGVPFLTHAKPHAPACERTSEQASDDFSGERLGLQWQFMANAKADFFSLTERKGFLRLYAHDLPEGTSLWQCPQALSQKLACPAFTATVTVDAKGLKVGEQAGFALLGGQYAYVALRRNETGISAVYVASDGDGAAREERMLAEAVVTEAPVTIQMTLKQTGYAAAEATFAIGDEKQICPFGAVFQPARHTWVGARLALFAMPYEPREGACGAADFAAFTVTPTEEQA